jgi:cell division protein FtsZ
MDSVETNEMAVNPASVVASAEAAAVAPATIEAVVSADAGASGAAIMEVPAAVMMAPVIGAVADMPVVVTGGPLTAAAASECVVSPKEVKAAKAEARGERFEERVKDEFGLDVAGAKMLVMGVGGGGSNTISRLTDIGITGARTIALNTDARHLGTTRAHQKFLLGKDITRGLGAGGFPEVGKKAALESEREIRKLVEGIDMVFLVAGMGGGTGTGAAPVIARIAKEAGAIVISNVTMPFKVEGARMGKAEDGLYNLRQHCDTVIAIENDRLLKVAGNLPLKQAFSVADDLVASMIKGITETISTPSLVNLDYADVKTIMHSGGVATVGFGEACSKDRALECIIKAMSNPLLDVDYHGGSGALIHITGGTDLRLDEVSLIGEYVCKQLDPDAQVIWGARIDPTFRNKMKVITIVTGVKSPYIMGKLGCEPHEHATQDVHRHIHKELGIPLLA